MRVSVSPEQIRQAFEIVKDDPSFRESVDAMKRGRLPGEMLRALSLRPEILRHFITMSDAFYPGGVIPERRLKELVIIEVSRRNACQFCANAHVDISRLAGIPDDPLALLDDPSRLTERESAAIEYTRAAAADANRIPQRVYDRLRSLFSEPEIVELTFLIGNITALNLFNNALQIHYNGEYLDAPAERA